MALVYHMFLCLRTSKFGITYVCTYIHSFAVFKKTFALDSFVDLSDHAQFPEYTSIYIRTYTYVTVSAYITICLLYHYEMYFI